MATVEIGGLMAYVFKVLLGNPDIILILTTWTVLVTTVLTVLRVSADVNDHKRGAD